MRRLEERLGPYLFNGLVYTGFTLLVFLAYSFALKLYFIQDDFGFIVRHLPGSDVPFSKAFIPEDIYYRPFTQHIWYYIVNAIFNLNPFWYHLVNLIVHSINIILVYHIGRVLTRNLHFGLLLGLIYGTRTLAYQAIIWPSAVNELLVTFFLFATFLAYQRYVATDSRRMYWLSVAIFFMAMLSKENSPTLIVMLFVYNAWIYLPGKLDRARFVKIIRDLVPHIIMIFCLALIKLTQFSAIQQSAYRMAISKATVKTYLKFFLSFMNPSADTIAAWRHYFFEQGELVFTIVAVCSIGVVSIWWFSLQLKRKHKSKELGRKVTTWEIGSARLFLFGCLWWVVAFFVTGTMPDHASQYYGLYPGLGLAIAIGAAFFDILLAITRLKGFRNIGYALAILLCSFFLWSYFDGVAKITNADQFRFIYMAREAERVRDTFIEEVPNPEKGTHFVLFEGDGDFRWVTSTGHQLRLIYDDLSIRISFPKIEDQAAVESKGIPDYYIRFYPNGIIVDMEPHTIEIGEYIGQPIPYRKKDP